MPAPGTAPLQFTGPSIPEPQTQIRLSVRLPAPQSQIRAHIPFLARLVIKISKPAARTRALYDTNVWRGLIGSSGLFYRQAAYLQALVGGKWANGDRLRALSRLPWKKAEPRTSSVAAYWSRMAPRHHHLTIPWQEGAPFGTALTGPWIELRRTPRESSHPWGEGRNAGVGAEGPWQERARRHRLHLDHWQEGKPAERTWLADWQPARRFSQPPFCVLWGEGLDMYGISWPFVPRQPPSKKSFCPPLPGTAYLFFEDPVPISAYLFFADILCKGMGPPDQIVIPIRRIYFMLHSAILVRLPDHTEIPAQALQIGIDLDSYTWRLSGTVLGNEAWDALQPDPAPVEVKATINGYVWKFVVEDISRLEQFSSRLAISINGRGLAAYLDAPYAASTTHSQLNDRNIQQLAGEALNLTGWGLTWEAADWLIPGGVWDYHATPLQAVIRLVSASGAVLQADRENLTLRVLPRYPILPWQWYEESTIPDVIMPPDVVLQSTPRLVHGADYNGIYISGEDQGILAHVRLTDTLGDLTASMLVNNLITHVDGARALGSKSLAELVGDRYEVGLTLPLSSAVGDTPLILPGNLVSYNSDAWRGLVEGIMISARWSNQGGLVVRQTLQVDRRNS